MLELPLFGSIRHMKLIGDDPRHKALRARNERRLAALKASHRLYEDQSESATTRNQSAAYVPGAALGSILGLAPYPDPFWHPDRDDVPNAEWRLGL